MSTKKFNTAVDRLVDKIGMSKTPVPGFIIGLSGTDSVVAFMMLYNALAHYGKEDRLIGIHYAKDYVKGTWFSREVVPWLQEYHEQACIFTVRALGSHHDQQRWADLMLRSTHYFEPSAGDTGDWVPRAPGDTFWLSGTINATEKELGKYSQMQKIASIQPIQTFWKSEILDICEWFGVPKIAIENSRLPDCLCGRDDLAAANIDLIDKLLRFQPVTGYPPELVAQLTEWIRMTKQENSYRERTPYLI